MTAFDLNSLISRNASSLSAGEVLFIPVERLVPFHSHMFTLYDAEREQDMVASIKENGIINPIIVQPKNDGEVYEILCGHNRWNCGKIAGLTKIPCFIKTGLSEEEAIVYVIESNIMQRGFNNLKISERALVIKNRYTSMFSQEKRNAIINDIYNATNDLASNRKRDNVSKEYELSSTSVGRLLRIAELKNEQIVEWINEGIISLRAGVELSFIAAEELEKIVKIITNPGTELSEKRAKLLRAIYKEKGIIEPTDLQMEFGKKKTKKEVKIHIPEEIVNIYFTKGDGHIMSEKEIVNIIIEALKKLD